MEKTSPEEFIELPVVDIEMEFIGCPGMSVTLNDTPAIQLSEVSPWLEFTVPEQNSKRVRVPMRNLAWYSVTRRIDRIPKDSEAGKEFLNRS